MAHVKWLREITLVDRPFAGFQNVAAYRKRQTADELGEPITRIAARALLMPPGFPDFMSRARIVRPGRVPLSGRAWSGCAPITRVEVSVDDGRTWADARLDPDAGHRWAWRRWTIDWHASPGWHALAVRATDAAGNAQPTEQPWNRGGFANNLIHRVQVACIA
jgi:hypothetical protein